MAGVAVGAGATWKFVKTRYEKIAQEEIDSVKEVYSNREYHEIGATTTEEESDEESSEPLGTNVKPDLAEYAAKVLGLGYATKNETTIKEDKDDMSEMKPYVITPEEFDEYEGYEAVSLTYYADGVVTDEDDEPIPEKDFDYLFGKESLTHFGEYEEDSVFVRNDRIKADYEILRDLRNYADTHRPETE
jgi:hypothetical protein